MKRDDNDNKKMKSLFYEKLSWFDLFFVNKWWDVDYLFLLFKLSI